MAQIMSALSIISYRSVGSCRYYAQALVHCKSYFGNLLAGPFEPGIRANDAVRRLIRGVMRCVPASRRTTVSRGTPSKAASAACVRSLRCHSSIPSASRTAFDGRLTSRPVDEHQSE